MFMTSEDDWWSMLVASQSCGEGFEGAVGLCHSKGK